MIRVLHVIGAMGSGGAEAMLMNLYRVMDRSKIQFDFVVHTDKKAFYDEEIEALGGRIFHTEKYNVRNFYSYKKFWREFLAEHPEYQIVHGHINSSATLYLSEAKRQGRIAVVHSHATRNKEKSLRTYAFLVSAYPIRHIADYFFGCSQQAGIDRFGERATQSDRFQVLNNGIFTEKYIFNQEIREKIRAQYEIAMDTIVVGHVGRFTFAKNHEFLIDVFCRLHEIEPNSKLMLIGIGELEERIREKVEQLNLRDAAIFVGQTNRVYEYLQAMDVFAFPSVFEGLGIALVEAQAAGLPCVVSENIQQEADIGCGLVHTVELAVGSEKWAEMLLDLRGTQRENTSMWVQRAGFDIQQSSQQLQAFYEKLV